MTAMEQSQPVPGGRAVRHLLFGVALVVLGALMLVDRLAIADLTISYWPFFVIAFGLVKLVDPGRSCPVPRSRRSGVWLLFVGCWGIVNELRLFGLGYETSWPLLVVGAGAMLIWRWYEGPDACARPREN